MNLCTSATSDNSDTSVTSDISVASDSSASNTVIPALLVITVHDASQLEIVMPV